MTYEEWHTKYSNRYNRTGWFLRPDMTLNIWKNRTQYAIEDPKVTQALMRKFIRFAAKGDQMYIDLLAMMAAKRLGADI